MKMSLFRSRAKILGQLSRRNITIPRSASSQSEKTGSRLNHSVAELSGIKNVGEIPEREGQKPQITLSRSLFSLFRKKGPNAQDDVTNTCSVEKGQESWLSKMLTKPPRPMTPQEKCMMKTREMQKKQEVGLIQIPCQDWKPSVTIVTTENNIPKSNLARSPAPPPTLQPVPPPSVETRLMELHEKHNTCVLHSEMEMDMHKYIPKLPYSEFKPRKKETPEQFCMEKYEDKRSATSDIGDRRKPVSAHSHRRTDRKFSWYTQQSLERSEPAFANMQSNTALIHTGRKNIQYFTHRNYVEPRRRNKIRGNSLQTQVSKRKYILAHTQIKEPPKFFPLVNNERKTDQFSPNLVLGKKSNKSELPSVSFTAKSLTQIPKIPMKHSNETGIKHTNDSKIPTEVKTSLKTNSFRSIAEVGQHLQLVKSKEEVPLNAISSKNESTISTNKKTNTHIKEVQHKHLSIKRNVSYNPINIPQSNTSVHVKFTTKKNSVPNYQTKKNEISDKHDVKTSDKLEKEQNQKLLYKLEFRRWMKRIKEKERTLGHFKTEMKSFSESQHVPISSKNKVTHINNENISKGISKKLSHQTQESPNKITRVKNLKALKESQTKLVQSHVKDVSIPSLEVLPPSSNLRTILPIPKKPLWENVISYTEAKANVDVSIGKKRDYHEYSISQTHNQLANSLGTLQKLLSSQVRQSESLNRFRTKSSPNIKDTIIISNLLRNGTHISKTEFTNVTQDLHTNFENTVSEKSLENHNQQVLDEEIKENEPINDEKNRKNEKDCDHVQQIAATDNTSSIEVLLQRNSPPFPPKNETSITNIYQQLTNDLQSIQSVQEKTTQSITELLNHVTNCDCEEKHGFSLKNNDYTFGINPSDTKIQSTKVLNFANDILPKTEILVSDVFHSCSGNLPENKNHQTSDLVSSLFSDSKELTKPQTTKLNEKLFSRNLEEGSIDQLRIAETYTNQKNSENNPQKNDSLFASPLDIKDSQTEWLIRDNFFQNCSSQVHSQAPFTYETIQSKSCNGLVPIETYNSMLNKNWTVADYAAYFYGAIFGKQDLLNMHLHKLLGFNDKDSESSLLENAIMNTSSTTINELKSDQIPKPLKTECSCRPTQDNSAHPLQLNNAEIKDEVLVNAKSNTYAESSESNKTSNNDAINKGNSENKYEKTKREDTEHSSENTPNTVKCLSSSNSCPGSIQCCSTKRNYSSWSIQEPFNPNQSSYECKARKSKKDPAKKGKKSKKGRIVPKQMVCREKIREEAVKKIHLPGCKLPSASGCSDDRIEALPCIKKEAPAPSFSECLRYPIKKTKFTECDCHKKKYPKCKTGYVLPKNYDACRKKEVRPKPRREKEEELEDIDEGQQPPCDK